MTTSSFYDNYHQKNRRFSKVIGANNFTYFYILKSLDKAWASLINSDFDQQQNNWQDTKVLDVGCGVGTLVLYLADLGAEATGWDISKRAITIANQARQDLELKNAKFIKGEIKKKKSTEEVQDLVISTEVIEHILDDKKFLADLVSHLRVGGVLLLSTPSSENKLYKMGYYKNFDREVGHLRRYTKASLLKLFEDQQLKVVSIEAVEGPLRNLLFTSKLGFLIRFIKGPLVPIFHVFDRWSASMFGASDWQIIAKKVK
jgi:2-polyprenyl-3-methyl-5-hydroxy-6-metoxy-1,4-benzoquinol methylase